MISSIKTAVILVLIIDFIQLLGGGKEYGHFIKLVTGLLVACSLCGGILQMTGSITEDTWLSWLAGEGIGLESVWMDSEAGALESVDKAEEDGEGEMADGEENTRENTGIVEIEVPKVEDIPKIEVENIRIEN
ncbi:MAG: hypothetical protein LUE16_07060 [Lachnospiraceae bacterium]|nr:hypothetical protein [Lachnospiraceae bacterium]